MSNPIKGSDLYQDDGAIAAAITELKTMRRTYKGLLSDISKQAEIAVAKLKEVNTTTAEGQKTVRDAIGKSSQLGKAQKEYTSALNDTNTAMRQLKKQRQDAIKNQALEQKFAKSAEGSYSKLSAEYAIVKLRLNDMGKAQRENTAAGQALEKQARAISTEMKTLQAAQRGTAAGTDKLSKAQRAYDEATSTTAAKIRALNKSKKEEIRLQDLQKKLADSAEGSYNRLSAQYSLNKLELNKMSGAERNATKAGQDLENQTREIYEEMNRLQKATGKHQLQVGNYGIATERLHPILGRVDMALQGMGTSLETISKSKNPFQALTVGIANFGKAALAFALSPIGLVITALGALFFLIKGNKDLVLQFDDGMKNISKTTGLVGDDLDRVGTGLVSLSRRLKTVGTGALQDYATVAGQLGVRGTKNILNFSEALAKLETASDVSGEGGASDIARFLTLADGGVENVKSFGDELVNLGNNFAATENEILGNATAIAQNTAQYKLGRQPMLAYATATKAVGLEAEIVGSTMGRSLGLMEKAIRTGKGMDALARVTGQSVQELTDKFAIDKAGSFNDFIKGLNDIYKAGGSVNGALDELGITAIRDQRVIASLATEGYDVLAGALDKVGGAAGAMDEEFATASTKLSKQWDRMGIAWDNLVLTIENGEGIFGKTFAFIAGFVAGAIEDFTVQVQFGSAILNGFIATIKAVPAEIMNMVSALNEFTKIDIDLMNPGKMVDGVKAALSGLKKQTQDSGAAIGEAFMKGFGKTIAIMGKIEGSTDNFGKASADSLEENIKASLETVGELDKAIQALQTSLSGVDNRKDAAIIQKQIADLEAKKNAILGVANANIKEAESRSAEIVKAQLDIMPEGQEKEIATLELAMAEKRKIWAKYGLDITQLEAYEATQRAAINQKYREQELKDIADKEKAAADIKKNNFSTGLERINQEEALAMAEIDILNVTEAEKTRLRLQAEKDRLLKVLELNKQIGGQLSDLQIKQMQAVIGKIDQEMGALGKSGGGKDLYDMLGITLEDEQKQAISQATQFAIQNVQAMLAAKVQAAEQAVQAAQVETDAAKSRLNQEIEARNNGYANNVDTAAKELELARKNQSAALKEKQKAQRAQEVIDTAMQTSSLITASANIWKSLSSIPVIGVGLAVAALGTMWASFAASKMKAGSAVKQTYGEGGLEFLNGGSHASGNDIPIGTTATGKQRTAEGGEAMAIINKRNTLKYRKQLPGIIAALNKGTFESSFGKAFIPAEEMPASIFTNNFDSPDLKAIESDLTAIREQGAEKTYTNTSGQLVKKYKNITTTYV